MARPHPLRRQVPLRTAERRLKVTLSMSVAETCLANQGGDSPTIVTISNDMTRLGVCTELCEKLVIRHTQVGIRARTIGLTRLAGTEIAAMPRLTAVRS